MRLELNLEKVLVHARQATTEELLDRVTLEREGMEPEALAIIEKELRERGVTAAQVADHAERYKDAPRRKDGTIYRCSVCFRPAMAKEWRWLKAFGLIPVLPWPQHLCQEHRHKARPPSPAS